MSTYNPFNDHRRMQSMGITSAASGLWNAAKRHFGRQPHHTPGTAYRGALAIQRKLNAAARPMSNAVAIRSTRFRSLSRRGGRSVGRVGVGARFGSGLSTGAGPRRGKSRAITKTGTRKKKKQTKRKRAGSRLHKKVLRLAKPKSFGERLDAENQDVPWDSTTIKSADTLFSTTEPKTVAGTTYITSCPFASASYNLQNIPMAYGDSLLPYVMAVNNSYARSQNYDATPAAFALVKGTQNVAISNLIGYPSVDGGNSIGTFASAIQGAATAASSADQGRTAYLQIKSYTDSYTVTNVSNTRTTVRVWEVRRKDPVPLVGTYAGCTVAGAAAPTYQQGTGDFEDQLEFAAITEEYQDTSIYDAQPTVPLPYVVWSAPSSVPMSAASGTVNNAYATIWDQPMSKWRTLKQFNKIKLGRTFTLEAGGHKTITYKYNTKYMGLTTLALKVGQSMADSSNDRGETAKRLKLMFQCIGDYATSNDNDYQTDRSIAAITITNVRKLVHRNVASHQPAMKFVSNAIYSTTSDGFNRSFTHKPQVQYNSVLNVGPVFKPAQGHLQVDMYAVKGGETGGTVWAPVVGESVVDSVVAMGVI